MTNTLFDYTAIIYNDFFSKYGSAVFESQSLKNKSKSEACLHFENNATLAKRTKTASFTSTRFGMITQTPFINIIFCNYIQRENAK